MILGYYRQKLITKLAQRKREYKVSARCKVWNPLSISTNPKYNKNERSPQEKPSFEAGGGT